MQDRNGSVSRRVRRVLTMVGNLEKNESMIREHRVTDEWTIELGGRPFRVRRFRSGLHQGETWRVWGSAGHHGLTRDCHESRPSFKRAVAWMQAQLAA
jgi:hypothetical protein